MHSGDASDPDELVVVSHNWDEIRRLMWDYVGIVRTNRRLQRARNGSRISCGNRGVLLGLLVTSDLLELRISPSRESIASRLCSDLKAAFELQPGFPNSDPLGKGRHHPKARPIDSGSPRQGSRGATSPTRKSFKRKCLPSCAQFVHPHPLRTRKVAAVTSGWRFRDCLRISLVPQAGHSLLSGRRIERRPVQRVRANPAATVAMLKVAGFRTVEIVSGFVRFHSAGQAIYIRLEEHGFSACFKLPDGCMRSNSFE